MASPARVFAAGVNALFRLKPIFLCLLEAFDYAEDAQTDPRQFAIECDSLRALGLTLSDLRWLLAKRFAELMDEITLPGADTRSFLPLPATSVTARACLKLTKSGAETLRSCLPEAPGEAPAAEAPPDSSTIELRSVGGDKKSSPSQAVGGQSSTDSKPVRPIWDPDLRELSLRGDTVKRYKVPAANQELILNVFQEEGWPDWIDDPLPPAPEIDPKRRLQATVKSLNRCQIVPLLCFHCNGNGHRVVWTARAD